MASKIKLRINPHGVTAEYFPLVTFIPEEILDKHSVIISYDPTHNKITFITSNATATYLLLGAPERNNHGINIYLALRTEYHSG